MCEEVLLEPLGIKCSRSWYEWVCGILKDIARLNSDFSFVFSGLNKLWEP